MKLPSLITRVIPARPLILNIKPIQRTKPANPLKLRQAHLDHA